MPGRHQVTFRKGEGRLLTWVEEFLKVKFSDVLSRGTHIAAFMPTEELAKRAEEIRDEWRGKLLFECDALDCEDAATHAATLAKSEAEITLCGFHATKFALRGLLRTTTADLIPCIELEEIK